MGNLDVKLIYRGSGADLATDIKSVLTPKELGWLLNGLDAVPSTGDPDLREARENQISDARNTYIEGYIAGWGDTVTQDVMVMAMKAWDASQSRAEIEAAALPLQPAGDLREAADKILHEIISEFSIPPRTGWCSKDWSRWVDRILALLGGGKGEPTQAEEELALLDALMIELRGDWPQYQHYADRLNEIRGFKVEKRDVPPPKTGAVPSGQGEAETLLREAMDILESWPLPKIGSMEAYRGTRDRMFAERKEFREKVRAHFAESPSPATRSDEVAEGSNPCPRCDGGGLVVNHYSGDPDDCPKCGGGGANGEAGR